MSSVKMNRLFAAKGYTSLSICQPSSPIAAALERQNLRFHTVAARRHYIAPLTTWQIRQLLDRHQINTVFLHYMKDLWLVAPALIGRPHIRLLAFARMFLRNVNKKDFLHAALHRRLQRMIALSHIQKSALQTCLPLTEEQFVVIPNGVDTHRFQPRARNEQLRSEWGFDDSHFVFGLIGRLDRQKGSLEFVQAAARVIAHHPRARFVLVGGNTLGEGDFDREIRNVISKQNLQMQIVLTDFREDIPQVLNAIDAFAMPSYEENFANVLLEALASGLPAIGTNSGGTPEILDNGQAGLLCEPRSAESLAETMEHLLSSPQRVNDLKAAARHRAETVYDMERVFQQIEGLTL